MRERNFLLQEIADKDLKCNGCAACYNVCPVDAMTMKADEIGFLYPEIDKDICIYCELCKKACPVLNETENNNYKIPQCYAAQAEDEFRKKSSSGGIFSLIASNILSEGGLVVGVSLEDDLTVSHILISSVDDLHKLRKSKYVQSNVGLIYKEIEKEIKNGRKVLFSGTPCQVAGLKSYLGDETNNLYTIDIFCHGVPSNKMLTDYIQETQNGNVSFVDFRPNEYGWKQSPKKLKIYYGNDSKIVDYKDSEFEIGFHSNLILRDSCYNCKFAEFPRQGDISLGDFWDIKDKDSNLDDDGGTSVILVNSSKGDRLYNSIKERLSLNYIAPLDWLRFNRIHAKIDENPNHTYFSYLYRTESFVESVNRAIDYRFNIGLVGPWMNTNCGGALTYYALYKVLTDMGYETTLISQPEGLKWSPERKYCRFKQLPYPDYALAPIKNSYADQREFNENCDMFIVGSDQLFTGTMMDLLDGYADLEWVNNFKKKIAYAASFAESTFQGNKIQKERLSYFLKRFDYISVREKDGQELLKDEFGLSSEWVLDPVFLCDRLHWDRLISNGMDRVPQKPYVFGYVLDPSKDKENVIQKVSSVLGIQSFAATDSWADPDTVKQIWSINTLSELSNEEFLAYINKSDYIVTDSFHGLCFALIFHKPFSVIINRERGSSRFYSLLDFLGLSNRIVTDNNLNEESIKSTIDYRIIDDLISKFKEHSLKWIKTSIEMSSGEKSITDFDVAAIYSDRIQKDMESKIKWQSDCLNGRIDWLIGHVDNDLTKTDESQWKQLEDHRNRLDGLDKIEQENAETNKRQWEQLNDHRRRFDDLDKTQHEVDVTNRKQWEQLGDHRQRLDGIDYRLIIEEKKDNEYYEQLNELKGYINNLTEANDKLKTQNVELNEKIQILCKYSIAYRIRRVINKIYNSLK